MEKPSLVGERYRILHSLGEDKIGPVSLARDEVSGDEVVLRALASEIITDTATMERLEREIARLRGLHQEGIVSSYEFCYLRTPCKAFLVSEHVNGQTLRELLSSNHECFRDEKHFRTLAEQILSSIDYAHQREITHRDLTSDNVMLTPDNRIKILDFGIDAVISEFHLETRKKRSWATRRLSSSGMDVERSVPVDIYSLGKLFHEMLLGESPSSEARQEEEFLPVPGISAGLNLLILSCLDKEISERPESVRAILDVLEDRPLRPESIDDSIADLRARKQLAVGGTGEGASTMPVDGSAGRWWWRAGLVALTLLSLAILILWQWTRYDGERIDQEVGVEAQPGSAPERSANGRELSGSRPREESAIPGEAEGPEEAAGEESVTQQSPETLASYTVQVGAFGVGQSAQSLISRLRERGYEARVQGPREGNSLYLVWIGRYESVRAASGMQKRLESAGFHTYVRRVEESSLGRGSR